MPGRYCEGATFGLAWVPPKDDDGNRLRDEPYGDRTGDHKKDSVVQLNIRGPNPEV